MIKLAIILTPALAIIAVCWGISPTSTLAGIGIGLVLLAPVAAAAYISTRQR